MRFLYRKTGRYFFLRVLGPLTVLTGKCSMTTGQQYLRTYCANQTIPNSPHYLVYSDMDIVVNDIRWLLYRRHRKHLNVRTPVDDILRMFFNEPAGTSDIIYFTGIGDYTASNGIFKILTSVCSCHGFLMVSINVAYVLNATGVASETRRLAAEISGLGGTPVVMLLNSWNGADLKALNTRMDNLLSSLCGQAQSHICYPSLFNYHSFDTSGSGPCRLAALDEMLTILLCACPREIRPDYLCIIAARNSITYYLETLQTVHIVNGSKVPPPVNLEPLAKAGIPVVAQHVYEAELASNKEILERRSSLWAMVEAGGHTWDQVLTMPKFKADSKRYARMSAEAVTVEA
ncbi:hypothetical protein Unana1_06489 [Umbelopsis nana]